MTPAPLPPLPDDPFPEPDPHRSRPSEAAWWLVKALDGRWHAPKQAEEKAA